LQDKLQQVTKDKDKTIRQLKSQRDALYEEQVASTHKSNRSKKEEWLSPIPAQSRRVDIPKLDVNRTMNPFEEESEDSFLRAVQEKSGPREHKQSERVK
jgi:hypothetical protein